MERVWFDAFYKQVRCSPDEAPIILTESVMASKENREKLIGIMFENFQVPEYYSAPQEYFSFVASGKKTGIVLSSGYNITLAVPIIDGKIIKDAISSLEIGGHNLNVALLKLLTEKGYYFGKKEKSEIIYVKEKLCFVSSDYDSDLHKTKE